MGHLALRRWSPWLWRVLSSFYDIKAATTTASLFLAMNAREARLRMQTRAMKGAVMATTLARISAMMETQLVAMAAPGLAKMKMAIPV